MDFSLSWIVLEFLSQPYDLETKSVLLIVGFLAHNAKNLFRILANRHKARCRILLGDLDHAVPVVSERWRT
jgi:hypothetical protein